MEFEKLAPIVLTFTFSVSAGVVAWIVTNFFAEPLLHFYRLRRAIRESVFFTRNIAPDWKIDFVIAASEELRRHAAALEALWSTAPSFVKRRLARRGYDVLAASSGLTGLSNSFLLQRGERAVHRDAIEIALRFPRSYSDEQIKRIEEKL